MNDELMRPILTVDVVPMCLRHGQVHAVLQRRNKPPEQDRLALIGGYVHPEEDENAAAAARRVLAQKGGMRVRVLEQLMTFSGLARDARGWSASVAYYALLAERDVPAAAPGLLTIVPVREVTGLPFDHDAIVAAAVERLRRRASYSSLPGFFLEETFTLSALREAYRITLGHTINDSAFRRKIDELHVVEPVPGAMSKSSARPAQLYRLARPEVTEFNRTL
jgi:8-oxo-dGTP diphosphatase